MEIMIELFKKYSNFERTATRSEYWGVLLSVFALYFLVVLVSVGIIAGLGTFGAVVGLPMLIVAVIVAFSSFRIVPTDNEMVEFD